MIDVKLIFLESMMVDRLSQFTILNRSDGKWAFDNLAQMLSRSLWVDISEVPGDINYILCTDTELTDREINSFIPIESIKIAADKRDVERRFEAHNIVRPKTFILYQKKNNKKKMNTHARTLVYLLP